MKNPTLTSPGKAFAVDDLVASTAPAKAAPPVSEATPGWPSTGCPTVLAAGASEVSDADETSTRAGPGVPSAVLRSGMLGTVVPQAVRAQAVSAAASRRRIIERP